MAIHHWMLQGKGGVSKTVSCSFLAQYLIQYGVETRCFDTDPVNPTFTAYTSLNVDRINLITDDSVDPRKFDNLIDKLLPMPEQAHAVIDNGASSFLPLCNYIKGSHVLELLAETGHTAILHTVITGGQSFLDTLAGLSTLSLNFPEYPIVVWKCLKDGELQCMDTALEDTKAWKESLPSIRSVIPVPSLGNATFGVDLQRLFSRRQTFAEARQDNTLSTMEKHRLMRFWDTMRDALDRANIVAM